MEGLPIATPRYGVVGESKDNTVASHVSLRKEKTENLFIHHRLLLVSIEASTLEGRQIISHARTRYSLLQWSHRQLQSLNFPCRWD